MLEKNNIYLIGPMAAGKSTVGKILAQRTNKPFYDTDAELIKCTGVEISLIFELEGEEGFRRRETEKLKKLADLNGAVIATGGGIVLKEENRRILNRTKYDTKRPLLQTDNPRAKLEELMRHRAPLYESIADITISTDKANSKRVIKTIIDKLNIKS